MGNTLGNRKTAKIMKVNGEMFRLKTPIKAEEVVKDYPGYVLLESEAVKHFGIRAKPLEAQQELERRRLYFLVELPKFPETKDPRRVRSGINMSAKDRLENLKLARRSASDLTILKQSSIVFEDGSSSSQGDSESGGLRVKMRLPKAEVTKLMQESKDEAEATQRIMDLYMANRGNHHGAREMQQRQWKSGPGRIGEGFNSGPLRSGEFKKRVSFMPIKEGEVQLAVAS